jgi:hypothetical protein
VSQHQPAGADETNLKVGLGTLRGPLPAPTGTSGAQKGVSGFLSAGKRFIAL